MMPSRVTYSGLLDAGRMPRQNAKVAALERLILQAPQVDLGTRNLVHGGLCARWIFVPAGTVLTGALTNKANVCIVFGDIEVTTDDGPKRLTGFHVLPAEPGAKRAGHAIADTWWATVWRTDLDRIEDIEAEMTHEADRLQSRLLLEGETCR